MIKNINYRTISLAIDQNLNMAAHQPLTTSKIDFQLDTTIEKPLEIPYWKLVSLFTFLVHREKKNHPTFMPRSMMGS